MADEANDNGWVVRPLATHGTEIHALVGAQFRGSPTAVSAADDGVVRILDLTTGNLLLTTDNRLFGQDAHPSEAAQSADVPTPHALAVHQSSLYAGWSDGTVIALNLDNGVGISSAQPLGNWGLTEIAIVDNSPRRPELAVAGTDGAIALTSQPDKSRIPLRPPGMPVWSLAAVVGPDHRVLAAGVGEGHIERWAFRNPDGPAMPPIDIGWSKRARLLVRAVPLPDRPLIVAADFDQLVLVDVVSGDILGRSLSGVGEVSAIEPFLLHGQPAMVVGGVDGTVAVIDPLSTRAADRAADQVKGAAGRGAGRPGTIPPARLLVDPIPTGEPVAALGSVEFEGRDVILVGGQRGGVFVVEPSTPAPPAISDKVELQDDIPASEVGADRLHRNALAEALAIRLRRRHENGHEASFLVHLDGRWGSGKTTVLNFVANQLSDGWTIVRYNAWRESRVGPPWWTLLTALRDELIRRRSRFGRLRLWFREMLDQRIRASGLPATILLVLLALGVFRLIRPSDLGETLTTVQGVAATLTALATLFAGAQFVARFFGWHSPRGAKAFQDLDTNPMDRVAGHFSWLVAQEKRPIAYFIDDIDRCPAEDVVELLENVQTLVRDAAESSSNVLSPCFVVAGDGAWIRNAFEEHYADFTDQIAEPGRPLGYLFLAKIFQLTLPVPRIGPVRQAAFFRELLGLGEDPAASPQLVQEAHQQVAAAANDDAQQQVLAQFPRAVREIVAPAAVARQTEPEFAEATEHRLTGFAPLLPDNPRAVKRFLNAFAMTRSVRTVEGQAIPTAALALWTILQTRWPLLADALAEHPEWIVPVSADAAGPVLPIPAAIQTLLADPGVQTVVTFPDGGPLTPDLVRACSGG